MKINSKKTKGLQKIGQNVKKEIMAAGYKSQYEFWVECAGDDLSRDTIARVIKGEDLRVSTLLTLAELLKIPPAKLFS